MDLLDSMISTNPAAKGPELLRIWYTRAKESQGNFEKKNSNTKKK
jgi:hypothetical protein